MNRFIGLIFFALVALPPLATAGEYYVSSRTAPLWQTPTFKARQLAILAQGVKVEALDEKNGWVSVRFEQYSGWMLKLMLSESPPMKPTATDHQAMQTLEERARRRPSAFSSTAAARGLMNKTDDFGRELKLDFQALEQMESWRVTDQEALKFMTEGRNHEKKD